MTLLFKNIRTLILGNDKSVAGAAMKIMPAVNDAFLRVEKGLIHSFGEMKNIDSGSAMISDQHYQEIDATGRIMLPAWIDSHTHLVFAKTREEEFVDRLNGLSYEEIANRGGGILNSSKKLNETSEGKLFEDAWIRLEEIRNYGTCAVEIKSGYGLTVDGEMKMLRVVRRLKEKSPLTIKATFLGAHAYPIEFKINHQGYLDLLIQKMLPQIADENLADYVDVFCDRGFFSPDETSQILETAQKYGLKPKIHANELDYSGGIQVGVKNGAISVDHLECCGEDEINCLKNSKAIPTLLPSTAFFLGLKYPPARRMIDAGLAVALATDYNPGSSPSGRMSFVLSLACSQMKMLPEEALHAATINGAAALELESTHGSITVGKKANCIVTKPIDSYNQIPYSFGNDLIERVYIDGK